MFRFAHATAVIGVFALGCVQSHQDTPISETVSLSQEEDTDSDSDARDPFLVRRGSLDDSVHVQTDSNGEPPASDADLVEPVPVTGAVAHNGAPLAGAKVAFHGRYTAVGITDTDGRFALSTFEPDDGAFPGVYVVVIEADGLPRRYADKDTSGLTATVDPDSKQNEFEFVLDD